MFNLTVNYVALVFAQTLFLLNLIFSFFLFTRNDLWALGCTLYQMLSGSSPFKDASEWLIFQRIIARDLKFPDYFSDEARDIIDKLLVRNLTCIFLLSAGKLLHNCYIIFTMISNVIIVCIKECGGEILLLELSKVGLLMWSTKAWRLGLVEEGHKWK